MKLLHKVFMLFRKRERERLGGVRLIYLRKVRLRLQYVNLLRPSQWRKQSSDDVTAWRTPCIDLLASTRQGRWSSQSVYHWRIRVFAPPPTTPPSYMQDTWLQLIVNLRFTPDLKFQDVLLLKIIITIQKIIIFGTLKEKSINESS